MVELSWDLRCAAVVMSHEASTAEAAKVSLQQLSVHSIRHFIKVSYFRCQLVIVWTVQEWMDRYLQDKASATAELLTLLVQARHRLFSLRLSKPGVRPASCTLR